MNASLGEFAPAAGRERIEAIDALRGVAVLGILVMNVAAMAHPPVAYIDPRLSGGLDGANYWVWLAQAVLVERKLMSVFAMLFGAGVVIMDQRFAAKGRWSWAGVHYRRTAWLLAIGLLHAHFIWFGDILTAYALCALALYPLRRLRVAWLAALGVALLAAGALLNVGFGAMMAWMRETATEAQRLIDAGEEPSGAQQSMLEAWNGMQRDMAPTPEQVDQQRDAIANSPIGYLKVNAVAAVTMILFMFPFFGLWVAGGMMLLGMALARAGMLTGQWSPRRYARWAAVTIVLGAPFAALAARAAYDADFSLVALYSATYPLNAVGATLMAIGYAAAVMLLCKSNVWPAARARLAAVGRMALTNYIAQSVIYLITFTALGAGLTGRFDRTETLAYIAAVWTLQLIWSPWWLARYRFGPLEWLWRSLTYARIQPIRRSPLPLGKG